MEIFAFFLLGIFAHARSKRLGVSSIQTIKSSIRLVNWAKIWTDLLSIIKKMESLNNHIKRRSQIEHLDRVWEVVKA